jgi:choline dehydrogenase-like flavoprotein
MVALSLLGHEPLAPLTDLRLLLSDPRLARKPHAKSTRRKNADTDGHAVRIKLEQTPDPENRIVLTSQSDGGARARPELMLRMTPREREGHERGLECVASALGLDVARTVKQMRLKLNGRRYDFFWHHMGTTRMSDDPSSGVVDTDCRVHGTPNLYIAGSSVFPTGGSAPPTLTIVALALRIADEIAGTIQTRNRRPTSDADAL